jgi:hypothetical protein
MDPSGPFAGLRSSRAGSQSLGRVVFLPFPFDAIPAGGISPNTRTELLRRILNFLAPGLGGVGAVALERGNYTVPSIVTFEVSDSDLVGSGQITLTASNPRTGASIAVTANETLRLGTFRGTFSLGPTGGSGDLAGAHGDQIVVTYVDASRSQNVTATAQVDTQRLSVGIPRKRLMRWCNMANQFCSAEAHMKLTATSFTRSGCWGCGLTRLIITG